MSRQSIRGLILCAGFFMGISGCNSSKSSSSLFVYASLDESLGQQLIQQFQKDTGVKVEFVRLSTGEAAARIEAEKNNPQASVWLGGVGLGHAEIKHKGLSIPYISETTKKIPTEYKDAESYWNGIYLGYLAIAVNKDLLKRKNLPLPQTWSDLLDSKWKGLIQLPNPGTSGTSYNLMTTLITKNGEDQAFEFLRTLNQNVSQYTRSGQAPVKNAVLGECAVAVGYAQDILKLIHDSKAPLEMVYPKDFTGFEVAAVSMIKGAKQPELAGKLIDWMYSISAAKILNTYYISTVIPPIGGDGPALASSLKNFPVPARSTLVNTDADWAGKNKQRLIELWMDKVKG